MANINLYVQWYGLVLFNNVNTKHFWCINLTEQTKTFQRKTIEEVIARLADLLGTTDKQTLKLMSQLTEYDIEEILYALDIHNTYGYEFLNTYVYDKLGLNVSLARAGRTEIKEIAKTPFQEYGSENEKTRLQKLRDLFR